ADEEWDMNHIAYSIDEPSSAFVGTPLDGLEIGYRDFTSTGPPAGKFDFQSTALHEIGHLLGINNTVPNADSENDDGDYDLPSSLMNGDTAAVRTAVGSPGHIRPGTALMCDMCADEGVRRRPSAVDILAAASTSNWTNIDFPRKMLVDGTNFNAASSWLDSQPPNSSDDAFVTAEGSFNSPVELTANDSVGSLTVLGTYLSTGEHILNVNGRTLVERPGVGFVSLRVPAGGVLNTDSLLVRSGGLNPQGGAIFVDGDMTLADDGSGALDSSIQGHGLIDVEGTFVNNGEIRTSGGTLTITSSSGTPLDLDGTSGNGELEVLNGDLIVDGALNDPFDDTITVGSDETITFNQPWTLGTNGRLAGFGLPGTGTLAGAEATLRGEVVIRQSVVFEAPVIFESSAEVSYQTGSPPNLTLNGHTTYRGATFLTGGEIYQNGDATVESTTVISADFYDWDGLGTPSDTTVTNTTLEINTPQLESGNPALNGYGGTVTLTDANLLVTTSAAWRLDGTIDMDNSIVRGQELLNHGMVTGNGTILSDSLVNDGQVIATGGGTLSISTLGPFPDLDGAGNAGLLNASKASIHITGNAGAPVPFQGTLRTVKPHEFRMDAHGLQNQGHIVMSGGTYVAPMLHHEGVLDVQKANATLQTNVTLDAGSTIRFASDVKLIIEGSANFDASAVVTGNGQLRFAIGSTATGNAQIDVPVENFGSIEPGTSPGVFHVMDDYHQSSTGSLTLDIAGTTPGTEYDRLIVDKVADFGGDLLVEFDFAYVPMEGHTFDLLDFQSVIGHFDSLQFDKLPVGLFWNTAHLYSTGVVSIVTLTADFDNDGDVDGDDLTQWKGDFGGPGSDANGDGDSDGGDFLAWQGEFGLGVPLAPAQSVPEPSGLVWLAIAMIYSSLLFRPRLSAGSV
ncbi:MAG: hypothetical protein ACR2NM_06110, partial [Bythopirellula sp.]